MKKNFISMTILLLAVISITSCSKENTTIEQPSNCYKVSICATKAETKAVADGGAATFNEGDVVYVYNRSTSTWDTGNLVAESTGKNTTFSGILTKSYSVGDELELYYKTTSAGVIDNNSQDGALGNVKDAAKALVTVTSVTGTTPEVTLGTTNASFTNLQSIFRFQFRNNGEVINNIRFVRVFSEGNKLQAQYDAKNDSPTYNPVTVSRSDNLANSYFYAALRFDKTPNDPIVFQVIDADGKVYSGSKTAPTSGFENGKFYTSTVTVNLYTFTASSGGQKVCFSPGDLGVDNGVYSFTEPFAAWNQDQTSMTEKTNVPSTSKRTWFIKSEVQNGQTVYGIAWRIQNYASEWKYLVGIDAGRTIDNGNVSLYYKVHISTTELGDRYWCYLLPPDETKASDIGEDLISGTVTDYLKYIAKGFVLLMDTEHSYRTSTSSSAKWTYKSRSDTHSGYYQAGYVKTGKTYFSFGSSGPAYNSATAGSDYRIHTRFIHDVTVSTP